MRLLADEVASPIGTILVAARDGRLCALDFEDCRDRMLSLLRRRDRELEFMSSPNPFGISGRVRAYLGGDLEALDVVAVETGGTELQQRVWGALRRIPGGSTVTYSDLAAVVGRPCAARAIGSINALNPIAIAVPCHRVIGRDSSLTGYAGGVWRKRWLLAHEGAAAVGAGWRLSSVSRRVG
jgi:methylated-DNA-[protein]-cysteine S-methyltransferase